MWTLTSEGRRWAAWPTSQRSKHSTSSRRFLISLGNADRELTNLETELNHGIQKLKEQKAVPINEATKLRDLLLDDATAIVEQHWKALMGSDRGKTLVLRSGTLSIRKATASLEVVDEAAAMKSLRRLGVLRKFTRLGKRTIDKNALKKAPEVIAKMKGVQLKQDENLIIKPAKTQVELKRIFHPFRRTLKS